MKKPDLQKIMERFGEILDHHILIMKNNNYLLAENLRLMKENNKLRKELGK